MVIRNPSDEKLRQYILFALVESSWGEKKGLFFNSLTAKIIKKYDFRDFTSQERKEVYQRIKLILNSLVAENIVEFGIQINKNDFKILYTLSPEWENKQKKVVYLDELETLSIPNYVKTMQALYYAGLIEFHRHSKDKNQKTIRRNNWKITSKGKKALIRLNTKTGLVFEANIENLNETYFERCVLFSLFEYNMLGVSSDFRRICDNAHSKYLLYYAKDGLLEQLMRKTLGNLIHNGKVTYDFIQDSESGETKVIYRLTLQAQKKVSEVYNQTIENKARKLTNEQKELLEKISVKYKANAPLLINEMELQDHSIAKSLLKMGLISKRKIAANQQKQGNFYRNSVEGNNILKFLDEQNKNQIQQQI